MISDIALTNMDFANMSDYDGLYRKQKVELTVLTYAEERFVGYAYFFLGIKNMDFCMMLTKSFIVESKILMLLKNVI